MTITYGITKALSWLALIARENYYFKDQGLDIDFRTFVTGRQAMQALQKNWVDVANLVDVNIASLGYEKKQTIRMIATTQQKTDESLLARRDAGINTPQDLRSKRIAYLPKTSSHSFLYKFFEHHGLDFEDFDHVTVTPDVMQKRLLNGQVDAISIWEPVAMETRLLAGETGVELTIFQSEGYFRFYSVLAATDKALTKKEDDIRKILAALQQAVQFVQEDKDGALRILADQCGIPPKIFSEIWPKIVFEIAPIGDDFLDHVRTQALFAYDPPLPDYEKFIDRSGVFEL